MTRITHLYANIASSLLIYNEKKGNLVIKNAPLNERERFLS